MNNSLSEIPLSLTYLAEGPPDFLRAERALIERGWRGLPNEKSV
jgi:hypothetical protein